MVCLEPFCSGAGIEDQVDLQMERYDTAQVRNVSISVQDLTGSVAYSPGTEGADISFEYKHNGEFAWRQGAFGTAAFEYQQEDGQIFRAICWLWTLD
jgi:hypothetical protein